MLDSFSSYVSERMSAGLDSQKSKSLYWYQRSNILFLSQKVLLTFYHANMDEHQVLHSFVISLLQLSPRVIVPHLERTNCGCRLNASP